MDVESRIREIYGADGVGGVGVLHVASAGLDPSGGWHAIAINDAAPTSATDRFVLQLARARADAILTTGRNLRSEPALAHAPLDAPLARWRQRHLGREPLPRSVVLTSGRELDLAHPLFRLARECGAPPPLVWTGAEGAARLRGAAAEAGVEILADPAPSIRACVRGLCDAFGLATVLVEAGPSTAGALYEPPCLVDELLLSVFEESSLAPDAQGPAFVEPARWQACLPTRWTHASREQSGRWRFERHTRRRQ